MTNPFPVSAESRLRAAALSFRSLCEAGGWTRLRGDHPNGYALVYDAGTGLEVFDDGGERVAFYPEAELDDERWAPAAWTPEANSAS